MRGSLQYDKQDAELLPKDHQICISVQRSLQLTIEEDTNKNMFHIMALNRSKQLASTSLSAVVHLRLGLIQQVTALVHWTLCYNQKIITHLLVIPNIQWTKYMTAGQAGSCSSTKAAEIRGTQLVIPALDTLEDTELSSSMCGYSWRH